MVLLGCISKTIHKFANMIGTVYKSTGSWYQVKLGDGSFIECRIKGKLKLKGLKSTNPVAVGDLVEIEIDLSSDVRVGVIKDIVKRENYIIRKSVNLSKQTHIIASNIDLMFLVVTIDNPVTSTSFIDRFLVTAEAYAIKAVLLFNKIDLLSEATQEEQLFMQYLYTSIGYDCLSISATEQKGLDALKAMMKGKTSVFTGHSGVGKSTLINALEPGLQLKTKAISAVHAQGQHTTTFAEMYDLSFEAKIIDTPGIRGFGLVDMQPEEIGQYFPEFFALKNQCKFSNCLHKSEPGCAIKAGLDEEIIFWSRYKSYLQLLEGDDDTYRQDEYKQD